MSNLFKFSFVNIATTCFSHWILIPLFVIGAGLFAYFYFLMKNDFLFLKEKYHKLYALCSSFVGLLITFIFAFVSDCGLCLVFTVFDLILFLGTILFIIYDEFKNKDKTIVVQTKKRVEVTETKTLSESIAIAKESGSSIINKELVCKYFKENYPDEVSFKHRADYTKPGRGMKEGLPLADTFFPTKSEGKKCFIFMYHLGENSLFLIKCPTSYAETLKVEHPSISVSLFPKGSDTWFSVPVDSTWDLESIYKMLDDVTRLSSGEEPLTLKESIASAKEVGDVEVVNKKLIFDYLNNKYKDEVELHNRPNFTKPGRGMKEGLPLADTHYTLVGGRECFTYLYELDGVCLFLIKAPSSYGEVLRKKHSKVKLSKFPKSSDTWFSVPVDNTWTINDIYEMLDKVKAFNDKDGINVVKETHIDTTTKLTKTPQPEVEVLEEVQAYEVNKLMTDEQADNRVEVGTKEVNKIKKTMINIDLIAKYFENGETVTLDELKKRIPNFDKKATFYKVCGKGVLNKKLIVEADEFSSEAKKMILLTGGKVIVSKK